MDMNCFNCKEYNRCLENGLTGKSPMRCANYNRIIDGINIAKERAKSITPSLSGNKLNEFVYCFISNRK